MTCTCSFNKLHTYVPTIPIRLYFKFYKLLYENDRANINNVLIFKTAANFWEIMNVNSQHWVFRILLNHFRLYERKLHWVMNIDPKYLHNADHYGSLHRSFVVTLSTGLRGNYSVTKFFFFRKIIIKHFFIKGKHSIQALLKKDNLPFSIIFKYLFLNCRI